MTIISHYALQQIRYASEVVSRLPEGELDRVFAAADMAWREVPPYPVVPNTENIQSCDAED